MLNFNVAPILLSPRFKLIRQNIIYVVALLLFIFLGTSFLPKQILQYNDLRQKEQELDDEIHTQEARLHVIESININDLNQLLVLLNTLYPQKEDQFSVYPVIDNLEGLTGMLFEKKSSPFGADPQSPVNVSIQATATEDQIKTLLREYPYRAARVLTIDNLSMHPTKANPQLWSVEFTVAFHAQEAAVGKNAIIKIDPHAIEFARNAQQYFLSKGAKYTNISIKDEDIPLNYPIKKNPFND